MPSNLSTPAFPRWAHLRRRPGLRIIVVAPAVAVIIGMAVVVSNSVADELRRSATESAVHNVEAIVRGYVDPELHVSSLDLDAPHLPAIDAQLERLTQSGEIRRINVWSRDGRIVYSSVAEFRGRRFSIGDELAEAYSGDGVARYVDSVSEEDSTGDAADEAMLALPGRYLELYVPIRGVVDGNPIGVYEVYQDARLIEQRIDATRVGVFVVAVIAASLLVILISIALGGASRVLAAQNRRLLEQATTERLLVVDLQRSEERFRSLVQNASDGVLVLGEDGLIRYESPAVERILGRHAQDRIGRPATADVHPDDRGVLDRLLGDVEASGGADIAVEFRMRHADDSWRTLEAIAKNLLDDPAVGGVVVNYRDITERKALEEQLRHQAFHDVLTGLANRSLFRDRLGHALARASRGGRPTAVLYLDLDDFKAVNDRLGMPKAIACWSPSAIAFARRLARRTRSRGSVATSSRSSSRKLTPSRPPHPRPGSSKPWPGRSSGRPRDRSAGKRRHRDPVGRWRRCRRALASSGYRHVRGEGPWRRLPCHLRSPAVWPDRGSDGAEGGPARGTRTG